MPTTKGGKVKSPEFEKPPAGTKFMTPEQLKDLAGDTQGQINKAAQALGGKVTQAVDSEEVGGPAKIIDMADQEEFQEDEDLINVDIADRREFLRTLMAGEPFEKEYTLFGGRIGMVLQTRTVQDNKAVNTEIENLDGIDFTRARDRKRMIKSIKSLAIKTGKKLLPDDDPELVLDSQSDIVYSALLTTFREFEGMCDVLFKKANDPDFWTETDGAS